MDGKKEEPLAFSEGPCTCLDARPPPAAKPRRVGGGGEEGCKRLSTVLGGLLSVVPAVLCVAVRWCAASAARAETAGGTGAGAGVVGMTSLGRRSSSAPPVRASDAPSAPAEGSELSACTCSTDSSRERLLARDEDDAAGAGAGAGEEPKKKLRVVRPRLGAGAGVGGAEDSPAAAPPPSQEEREEAAASASRTEPALLLGRPLRGSGGGGAGAGAGVLPLLSDEAGVRRDHQPPVPVLPALDASQLPLL